MDFEVVVPKSDFAGDGFTRGTDSFQRDRLLVGQVDVRRLQAVAAVEALVDRSAGEVELGVPFYPLVSINFPVYDADALPPELEAVPAVKPGSRKQ